MFISWFLTTVNSQKLTVQKVAEVVQITLAQLSGWVIRDNTSFEDIFFSEGCDREVSVGMCFWIYNIYLSKSFFITYLQKQF